MFRSPLEILLEAEVKPSKTNDYTHPEEDEEEEEEVVEDETETPEDDPQPNDYTSETPEEDVDDEPETVEGEEEEELAPNDYTSETPEDETEDETATDEESDTGDETGEEGELAPNDYTSENPDEGDETDTGDGTDETTDDTSGDETTATGEETPEETEEQKKKELFEDFVSLYELNKEFINKLSSHSVSTIFVNKIMIQISKNLNDTRKSIWNHIMRDFDRMNYVQNLTKYNFFIENLRINIQMIDKVKDYVSKSETFK